jgi:hypothetical protein
MNIKKYNLLILILLTSIVKNGAQTNDSTYFYDYYLSSNLFSRIGKTFDVGVERIKPIKNNVYYAMQFSIKVNNNRLGISQTNKNTPYHYYFYGFCFQPFHVLIGNQLKLETGVSMVYNIFTTKGNKSYPVDTTNASYNSLNNYFLFIYTLGARYTLKKSQLSFKALVGFNYIIIPQKNVSTLNESGSIELGVNWRLRKRKKVNH